ncbi:MAG: phosphatase PAP2 family protein [Actinomycetota bacterium]|nr:phosphatase PAP2 family protein [Actinomycetota bacterium]
MEPRPWVRDFAPVAAAFALYPVVALAQGADRAVALGNASAIAEAEQAAGLFVEPAAYAWAAGIPWLLAAAGVAYLVLHVPVLLGALAWVYLARPAAFPRLRTAFLAAQTLTLAGYLLVPTAPPRMLGALGFGDTLSDLWGAEAAAGAHWLQSPFAAMPSGHVVFALLAGGALAALARPLAWRVAGALYPPFVVALTVVTANHFWLDAAGSLAVVAVAVPTALLAHRSPPRRARAYAPGSG